MIHLIQVLRTSLGWKLIEIICAHTLVFDLAEMAGFLDKADTNLAGASIAICQFCLRRGPCYELTSFSWLRAFIVSRRLPSLTQQRWHALQQSHSNLTNDWEVLFISELFVFSWLIQTITGWLLRLCTESGCLFSPAADFGCRSLGRVEEVGRTELLSLNKHLFVWLAFLPLIQNTWNRSLITKVFEALWTCVKRLLLVINWAPRNHEQKMKLKSGLACYCG